MDTMTSFLSVRCLWPEHLEGELSELFESRPVLGAQLGEVRQGWVELTVYLEQDRTADARSLADGLTMAGGLDVTVEGFPARDWLGDYQRSATPFAVGTRWWIDPHPGSPTPPPEGRLRLPVEPRSAFGSGSHESTRLMLYWLEQIPVEETTVIDVGTGSGILAMAAATLSAELVVGLDIDPEAAFVTRQTLHRQTQYRRICLYAGAIDAVAGARFGLVLCNMISSRFLPLLDGLARLISPGGRLVLAGFLSSEADCVRAALAGAGLHVQGEKNLGEWSSMTAVVRGE